MMLADASDPDHHRARGARDGWLEKGGALVTSDFVMDETLTLIRMRLGLDAAERWWEQVSASHRIAWEWVDTMRAEKARAWFFRWRDKSFSFTDCTSFVIMKELRLRQDNRRSQNPPPEHQWAGTCEVISADPTPANMPVGGAGFRACVDRLASGVTRWRPLGRGTTQNRGVVDVWWPVPCV